MCGIYCSVSPTDPAIYEQVCRCPPLQEFNSLVRRGPDCQNSAIIPINSGGSDSVELYMFGTVLHMRGALCTQPLTNERGDALLWNGEIFGGIQVPPNQNDGQVLFSMLSDCQGDEDVLNIFSRVRGPYAFVYFKKNENKLIFGRDLFGRRSLMLHTNAPSKALHISSVALKSNEIKLSDWIELPAAGLYVKSLDPDNEMLCYCWSHNRMDPCNELGISQIRSISLLNFNDLNFNEPANLEILQKLKDSTEPLKLAIDWLSDECEELLRLLKDAVQRRVTQSSFYCDLCSSRENHLTCKHSHIAIMFSGGIDSMMLAYLADQCVPENQPIDLLNVAFEVGEGNSYNVPDRMTGLDAVTNLNSKRQWNFVEVNVTKRELQSRRAERISELILPLNSVLDDSIGCALWFASRGWGDLITVSGERVQYESRARVVFSGLGADEQLGGYSRHRSSYQDKGWSGLIKEIDFDIKRIPARNLGRDDRIVSDHSKECRFPFLDEDVVSFLNQLPIHKKMFLELPRGIGEKLLLRACAYRCGLNKTARLAKRAIQFGSRIAKCENSKEKGSDVCLRLTEDGKDFVNL